jgi:hypothetical protein
VERADSDLVHPNPRPDQHHRSARRSDEIRHHRTNREEHDVRDRRRFALHFDVYPSGHHKQRTDKDDEREIFVQRVRQNRPSPRNFQHIVNRHRDSKPDGYVRVVVLPHMLNARGRQRHRRNQQEEQRERRDQPDGNIREGGRSGQKRRQCHAGVFRIFCVFRGPTPSPWIPHSRDSREIFLQEPDQNV